MPPEVLSQGDVNLLLPRGGQASASRAALGGRRAFLFHWRSQWSYNVSREILNTFHTGILANFKIKSVLLGNHFPGFFFLEWTVTVRKGNGRGSTTSTGKISNLSGVRPNQQPTTVISEKVHKRHILSLLAFHSHKDNWTEVNTCVQENSWCTRFLTTQSSPVGSASSAACRNTRV